MFSAMEAIRVHSTFLAMTTMFSQDAIIVVNINGQPSRSFEVQKGVKQECPFAPYLIMIVDAVFNHFVKQTMTWGEFQGVFMPWNSHH